MMISKANMAFTMPCWAGLTSQVRSSVCGPEQLCAAAAVLQCIVWTVVSCALLDEHQSPVINAISTEALHVGNMFLHTEGY
jgi:hypothetical protein